MKSFLPAFYFSSLALIIDDDELFIKSMVRYLSRYYKSSKFLGFTNTREAHDQIEKLSSSSIEELYKSKIFSDYDEKVTYTVHSFKKILNLRTVKKNDIISTVIVDYKMPSQDGLSFLRDLEERDFSKILFTGAVTDQDVLDAFNDGLIDFYINKGSQNLTKILLERVKKAHLKFFLDQTRFLTDLIIKDEENSLLKQVLYKNLVLDYVDKYKIKEFYLFDTIGSYFLRSDEGDYVLFVTEESKHQALVNAMEEERFNVSDKDEYERYLSSMKSEMSILFEMPFTRHDFSNFQNFKPLFQEAKVLYCAEKRYFYFFSKNHIQKDGKDIYFIS